MKKHYMSSVYRWSKRFATLLPLSSHPVTPSHLPRLMCPDEQLPRFVRECASTMALLPQLRLLAWEKVAQPSARQWFGKEPVPLVAYVGAFLVKIEQKLSSTSHLRFRHVIAYFMIHEHNIIFGRFFFRCFSNQREVCCASIVQIVLRFMARQAGRAILALEISLAIARASVSSGRRWTKGMSTAVQITVWTKASVSR